MTENYPDLKSNANFLALQSQLEGTENRIAVARRDYIDAVRAYNTALRTFPTVLWAKTAFSAQQADGGIHRQRGRANAAAGEILMAHGGAWTIAMTQSHARARRGADAVRAWAWHRALLCLVTAAFALDFPQLTGRVVDQAGVMSADSRSAVEAKLKDLEDKSGIQLVVATVKSLQGSDIETYANQLFRTWKLGQAQKNNGVLLLVAPAEHKVRIEVGYGLEGTLTDALSSVIISSAIVPRFKANDYSGGIERGVDGIISVLNGDTTDWQPKVEVREDESGAGLQCAVPDHVLLVLHPRFQADGRPDARHAVGTLCQTQRTARLCALYRLELEFGLGLERRRRRRIFRRRRLLRRRRLVGRRRRVGELVMHLRRRITPRSRPLFAQRSSEPADRSSACSRTRPPTMPISRSCGRACWRCFCPGR